jgi:hypothetical protein
MYNWQNESPLYHEYMLIKMKKRTQTKKECAVGYEVTCTHTVSKVKVLAVFLFKSTLLSLFLQFKNANNRWWENFYRESSYTNPRRQILT